MLSDFAELMRSTTKARFKSQHERSYDHHSQLVKLLVWNEYEREGAIEQWDAEAGTFHVYYGIELHHDGFRAFWDGEALGPFDTFDAAKAAVQADYAARILSALNLDAIEALQARVAELEAGLQVMANQKRTDEMSNRERREGDFEGGYDMLIDDARALLERKA